LNPQSARKHLTEKHERLGKPPTGFIDTLLKNYPTISYYPVHPNEPIPAIFGLQGPKELCLCPVCNSFYAKDSFSRGRHGKCDGSQTDPQKIETKLCQKFSPNNIHKYFPVFLPSSDSEEPDQCTYTLYREKHPIEEVKDEEPAVPENYRNLENFSSQENWPKLFDRHSLADIRDLVGRPKRRERFCRLYRHLFGFLKDHQMALQGELLHSVRRVLGTRPSYVLYHVYS
jgi:hypothetical protein